MAVLSTSVRTVQVQRAVEPLGVPGVGRVAVVGGIRWCLVAAATVRAVTNTGPQTWIVPAGQPATIWQGAEDALDVDNHAYVIFCLPGQGALYACLQDDWDDVNSVQDVAPIAWVDQQHDLVPGTAGTAVGGGFSLANLALLSATAFASVAMDLSGTVGHLYKSGITGDVISYPDPAFGQTTANGNGPTFLYEAQWSGASPQGPTDYLRFLPAYNLPDPQVDTGLGETPYPYSFDPTGPYTLWPDGPAYQSKQRVAMGRKGRTLAIAPDGSLWYMKKPNSTPGVQLQLPYLLAHQSMHVSRQYVTGVCYFGGSWWVLVYELERREGPDHPPAVVDYGITVRRIDSEDPSIGVWNVTQTIASGDRTSAMVVMLYNPSGRSWQDQEDISLIFDAGSNLVGLTTDTIIIARFADGSSAKAAGFTMAMPALSQPVGGTAQTFNLGINVDGSVTIGGTIPLGTMTITPRAGSFNMSHNDLPLEPIHGGGGGYSYVSNEAIVNNGAIIVTPTPDSTPDPTSGVAWSGVYGIPDHTYVAPGAAWPSPAPEVVPGFYVFPGHSWAGPVPWQFPPTWHEVDSVNTLYGGSIPWATVGFDSLPGSGSSGQYAYTRVVFDTNHGRDDSRTITVDGLTGTLHINDYNNYTNYPTDSRLVTFGVVTAAGYGVDAADGTAFHAELRDGPAISYSIPHVQAFGYWVPIALGVGAGGTILLTSPSTLQTEFLGTWSLQWDGGSVPISGAGYVGYETATLEGYFSTYDAFTVRIMTQLAANWQRTIMHSYLPATFHGGGPTTPVLVPPLIVDQQGSIDHTDTWLAVASTEETGEDGHDGFYALSGTTGDLMRRNGGAGSSWSRLLARAIPATATVLLLQRSRTKSAGVIVVHGSAGQVTLSVIVPIADPTAPWQRTDYPWFTFSTIDFNFYNIYMPGTQTNRASSPENPAPQQAGSAFTVAAAFL